MMHDSLFSLSGQRVLVAGLGGFGAPLARLLAAHGAELALLDIDAGRLARAGLDAPSAACDLTDESAVSAALDRLGGQFHGALNATGLLRIAPADAIAVDAFRRCMDVNVTGALLLSRGVAARMAPEGGAILHVASVSSLVANPGYAAYAASKAALAQLVRVLAREWAPRGIRVNAIGPALVDTELTAGHLADPAFRAAALAQIPMGRFGQPEDLFAMTLALIGPGGRFTTGQTIYVDGGRTLV